MADAIAMESMATDESFMLQAVEGDCCSSRMLQIFFMSCVQDDHSVLYGIIQFHGMFSSLICLPRS